MGLQNKLDEKLSRDKMEHLRNRYTRLSMV